MTSNDELNLYCPFPECDKVYYKQCKLDIHIRSHTGEVRWSPLCWLQQRPFVCPERGCSKSFTRKDHLVRHTNSHLGLDERVQYSCQHQGCGKQYTNKAHLRRHEKTHQEPRPYHVSQKREDNRLRERKVVFVDGLWRTICQTEPIEKTLEWTFGQTSLRLWRMWPQFPNA